MKTIKIEKRVPLPETGGVTSPIGVAMSKCKIGDSFVIKKIARKSALATVHDIKSKLGGEFTCRSLGPYEIRVWRVEPKPYKEYVKREPKMPEPKALRQNGIVEEVIKAICEQFELKKEDLLSKTRQEEIVIPRMAAYYIAKQVAPRVSSVKMGKIFGKDHGTILYGIKSCQDRIDTDPDFRKQIDDIILKYHKQHPNGNH